MYAILVSIALAIYTLVLVDFSLLFQEMSVNADVISATQVLYTAEGAAEKAMKEGQDPELAFRNIAFEAEKNITTNSENERFLTYNEEAETGYFNRVMSVGQGGLNHIAALSDNDRLVKADVYAASGAKLDDYAIYGLEPASSREFAIREVPLEDRFNEIIFEYNQGVSESSQMLFEIFVFPKEGQSIDFLDFDSLKEGFESSVQRVVINTKDTSQSGRVFNVTPQPLSVSFGSANGYFKNQIAVGGFNSFERNYIIRFQTLDNSPVHYKIAAKYQGQLRPLSGVMQTVDVIGYSTNGLYQRIKMQRQAEPGLLPGLNFVHFSNGPIHK